MHPAAALMCRRNMSWQYCCRHWACYQVCRFPYPALLPLQMANNLYGITVKPSQQKLPVWHPDVEVYEVYDGNSTTPLAYFYADLYARPGNKQSGAWAQGLADRARYCLEASPARAAAEIRSKGGNATKLYSPNLVKQQAEWLAGAQLQLPVAILVSNQNPPAGGKPSLMTLEETETLFHEFGHALQVMLTTVEEPLAAGMRWGGSGHWVFVCVCGCVSTRGVLGYMHAV